MPINAPKFPTATVSYSVNEGVTAVTPANTVVATDADNNTLIYSIVGGADRLKFKIDSATGYLTFVTPPDYENATDSGLNNVYDVIIQVQDGPSGVGTTLTAQQTVAVTVLNVNAVTINGTINDDLTLGTAGTLATVEGDTINGFAGNDVIDGKGGADTMIGGSGNDTFFVDNALDVTTELNTTVEGIDLVKSTISTTLQDNVENLLLLGSTAINGTGNTQANVLTGNTAANILDGGAGNDTMIGAAGNDVYKVDAAGDVVQEVDGGGVDRIDSTVDYSLASAAFVENLTLTGTAISGTGNALGNTIIGNASANTLSGGDGNDTLNGGAGNDALNGGKGSDIYIVDVKNVAGVGDVITESVLVNEGTDSVQASVDYSLNYASAAYVENLTLTGTAVVGIGNTLANLITGNALNNQLVGGDGNDTLDGKAGADALAGGNGDDTYIVDNVADTVSENGVTGTDIVKSSVNYSLAALASAANVENLTLTSSAISATGNDLNNVLTGNTAANILSGGIGNDTLNGMSGADSMDGGIGDDTYYVDNAGDTITDSSGTDKVFTSLSIDLTGGTLSTSNVENAELTGLANNNLTGNASNNVLTGNTGANTLTGLAGSDTLNGGRGADILVGGDGNDIYYITDLTNGLADTITEASTVGSGTDLVISTISAVAGYTLAANVENLTLGDLLNTTGNLNGTGNIGNNVITGNSGWNIIDGAGGNDTIAGGNGADTIIGGAGQDAMTGDLAGGTRYADVFKFAAITDSSSSALAADTITDFGVLDRIDVSAIDAQAAVDFQHFVLDTNNVLAQGEIGQVRNGNVITVSFDTDATAGANMVIQVTVDAAFGAGLLTLDNFIL